jgi:hypothetical protein
VAFKSEPTFFALHAIRLKGVADTEVVAEVTGVPVDWATETVEALAAEALVQRVETNMLQGWQITGVGRERHTADLAFDVDYAGCRDQVGEAYKTFLGLNERFKVACTAWQLRPDSSGALQPNDHADDAYDDKVRDGLGDVHESVVPALERLSISYERFGRYPIRFHRALTRLDDGHLEAFTRPMSDSYHDVWMELHQDLLLTLGRTRSEEDGH